ncbi:molybdate ABC transporter substrate-binding protein [Thermotalea metallivorans]|uniref:Molybdate-binding periplasmic protein n=1 Tax=Thermotalea metallivorans TaxID=520762 RepID=A0A140LCG7_9FIRM|nr:molybdate ABC transporter substrate-binding protein [Thermotalea metallivorans]KXG78242.1 Molybdate-binding periplasmic protein [Thermotalea metallivorans]
MKKIFLTFLILAISFIFEGCSHKPQTPSVLKEKSITISAAASLEAALKEIGQNFQRETRIPITFNFAASGVLQKQIEAGLSCDVFISAAPQQMKVLEDHGLIDRDSRTYLLKNKLTLIVAKEYGDKISAVSDLLGQDIKMAIGTPASVPAGQYAKESLIYLNLWDQLKGKIVYTKDVSQIVTYVERGELAAGIVYSSDAARLTTGIVKEVFPEETHQPIVYPAAILSSSRNKDAARQFLNYLNNSQSIKIFKAHGFEFLGK